MNQLIYCPECGNQLRPDGGCMMCVNPSCGWNSCDFEQPSTEEILRQQNLREETQDDYKDQN